MKKKQTKVINLLKPTLLIYLAFVSLDYIESINNIIFIVYISLNERRKVFI